MRTFAATVLALLLGAGAHAQAPAALLVVSPKPGERVTGLVTLRVQVPPGTAVERLSYRVDGRVVCTTEREPWTCEWDAGSDPAVHVVRAVAELAGGSRLVATTRTAGPERRAVERHRGFTLSVDVDVVQVAATVTDGKGRYVRGLRERDFRLYEDDALHEVSHLVGQDAPRDVVVAVDMSGSMTEAMPRVKESVRRFLAALRPDDHVTLLAFNDAVFTLARRESDPGARSRAVDRLMAWGGTSLHDVIIDGMNRLGERTGRKVLVVFTDGDDQSSRATVEDVRRRAETSDAPVYLIGQGRGTSDPRLQELLATLARMSGGRAFHVDTSELDRVFAEIVEELDNQYLLGYQPQNAVRDGTWREIRVEVAGKDRRVRARQGYRRLPKE